MRKLCNLVIFLVLIIPIMLVIALVKASSAFTKSLKHTWAAWWEGVI